MDPAWDQNNCGGYNGVYNSAFSCIIGRCTCPNELTACIDAGADAGYFNTQRRHLQLRELQERLPCRYADLPRRQVHGPLTALH